MVNVFVDGQAGTTGLKIYDRLARRQEVRLIEIVPERRKDPAARQEAMTAADIVFLCLPDDAAREAVTLAPAGVRIIDASCAHRTQPGWTYGFPELSDAQRNAIASAARVTVPGCHATGLVALVAPLVAAGVLPQDYPLSAHSVTGYSGGGKQMIAEYEDPARDEAFGGSRVYALDLTHKHVKEMQFHTGLAHAPLFSPILGDFFQGMLVSVPLHTRTLSKAHSANDVRDVLRTHYAGSRFVHAMPDTVPDGGRLNPQALNGTNDMELFVFGNDEHVLLVARLDNLGKGASGAAVQCMNIMLGLPEETGLVMNG